MQARLQQQKVLTASPVGCRTLSNGGQAVGAGSGCGGVGAVVLSSGAEGSLGAVITGHISTLAANGATAGTVIPDCEEVFALGALVATGTGVL